MCSQMNAGMMTGIVARGVNLRGGGNVAASAQLSLSVDRAAATRDSRRDSRAASRSYACCRGDCS